MPAFLRGGLGALLLGAAMMLAACGDEPAEPAPPPVATPVAAANPAPPVVLSPAPAEAVAPPPPTTPVEPTPMPPALVATPEPTPAPGADAAASAAAPAAPEPLPPATPAPAPETPTPAAAEPVDPPNDPLLLQRIGMADIAHGQELAARCSGCHAMTEAEPALMAPGLYGVVGATVGRDPGYTYSFAFQALRDQAATWNYGRLDAFLASPQLAVPGTRMGFSGFGHEDDRAAVIAYLRTLADEPFPIGARVGVVVAGLEPVQFLGFQASNGQDTFTTTCSSCHGLDLLGRNGMAPPLVGEAFAARWFGGPIFDLLDFIRRQKPPGAPSSLSNATYVNLVAYILRANGFASNLDTFLPPTRDALTHTGFYQY